MRIDSPAGGTSDAMPASPSGRSDDQCRTRSFIRTRILVPPLFCAFLRTLRTGYFAASLQTGAPPPHPFSAQFVIYFETASCDAQLNRVGQGKKWGEGA